MTDIKFLKDRIIFDGHSDTREECETITLMCDNLAKSKDFKTIKYENGYAEFERINGNKELKFAPSGATLTINFDSNITKVAVTEQGLEWTSSGQTNNVSVSTTGGANNWTFTVTLANGYVINTVTPGSSESFTMISNVTTTTFISNMGNGAELEMELTITSKSAATTNIPAGYFTWNGAKRLVHADDLYNSDGTKKNVAASYVEITSPSSATNGNLTQAQLSTLQASKENKIIFDNEVYICQDVGHDAGFLVYTHVGRDNTTNYWLKCIGITISTLGWVKTEMQLVGKEYVDNLTAIYRHTINIGRLDAPAANTLRCVIISKSNTKIKDVATLRKVMNIPTAAIYLPVSGAWISGSIHIAYYVSVIQSTIKVFGYDITTSETKTAQIYETNFQSDIITEI